MKASITLEFGDPLKFGVPILQPRANAREVSHLHSRSCKVVASMPDEDMGNDLGSQRQNDECTNLRFAN